MHSTLLMASHFVGQTHRIHIIFKSHYLQVHHIRKSFQFKVHGFKLTAFTSSSCAETRRDCRCENLREKQLKQEGDNKFCMFLIEFEKRQFYHFFVSPIGYVGMICNRYIWQGSQGLVIGTK